MAAADSPRWGWHQLADHWAERLVRSAGVGPGDLVLDLGAGTGAITAPLLAAGAKVVAFEMHEDRAATLRERFDVDSLRIVRADVSDLRLPRRPFQVVANPPFAVTASILRRLVHPSSRLVRADLIVPRPIAVRWASGRGPAGGRVLRTYDVAVTARVPTSAFRPPPPSAPAVLTIVRRGSGRPMSRPR
ncbi:MAG: rRNA adenine N-6-methyltransferase family protein [Acidimicrobiales bacterium]